MSSSSGETRPRSWRFPMVLCATALLWVLVLASGAPAATTVSSTPGELRVSAGAGDANQVVVFRDQEGKVRVRDAGAAMVVGTGCEREENGDVSCNSIGANINADLGDGNDRLGVDGQNGGPGTCNPCSGGTGNDEIHGALGGDAINGGEGNDTLTGGVGSGRDVLDGGPGNDSLGTAGIDEGNDTYRGGRDNDTMLGGVFSVTFLGSTSRSGADTFEGGPGFDIVIFERPTSVSVSLDGAANDGTTDEGDNVGADVENVTGGEGADRLVGNAGRNRLDGGPGVDVLDGKEGDDTLLLRDGLNDQKVGSACGKGNDVLDADLRDDDTRSLPADCETVAQGALKEGRNVAMLSRSMRLDHRGIVRMLLRCPAGVTIGCQGTLAVKAVPRGAAVRRYSIRPGRSARVAVSVPAALRRALAQRSKVAARFVSIETGTFGAKTTIRQVTLVKPSGT